MASVSNGVPIGNLTAAAYQIPTDHPEADGTMAWTSTTLVVVEVEGGGKTGLGYTYTDGAAAQLIGKKLAETIHGHDAMDPPGAWRAMQRAVRNMGRAGLAATAISAVDTALWDLKAKLLDLPLALLLGRYRDAVPIYGSGGFTTYSDGQLRDQLSGWVERDGCRWVKMKVGTDAAADPGRVTVAKSAIGDRTLFVDANGAYSTKQALALADIFRREAGVAWFEEPVSSDDLEGLQIGPAARTGRDGNRCRRIWLHDRLFSPDADCRRDRCAAGGHHPVRGRNRVFAGGCAMRGAPYRSVRSLRSRAFICTPPVPRRGFATWSGFTTMSASNTCCSMARRRHAMASSDRTCRGLAWGWRSNGTMPRLIGSRKNDGNYATAPGGPAARGRRARTPCSNFSDLLDQLDGAGGDVADGVRAGDGKGGAAAQSIGGYIGDVGAAGQRGGALPRLVQEQGDVHAADHFGTDAGGQRARDCRQTASRAWHPRCDISSGGADGFGRDRVSCLQRDEAARRDVLAESVLRRTAWRPVGDPAVRPAGLLLGAGARHVGGTLGAGVRAGRRVAPWPR